MSSYDIKYAGPNADKNAIRDIKNYIGKGEMWERILIVVSAAVASGTPRANIHFLCSFAGIQGFPVDALIRHVCEVTGCSAPAEDNDEA